MSGDSSGFRAFLAELKRRKVYRVAVGYAAAAFVVWQAAEIALPALGFSDAVLRFVVVGSIVGFPVALVLAWVYELRPDSGSDATGTGQIRVGRWATLAAVCLVAVVGGLAYRILRPTLPGHEPLRIAVFPLATLPAGTGALGEGVADLIALGLDGTPGLTAVDPKALWTPLLRAGLLGDGEMPEGRYAQESRRFDASHFVTGMVLRTGSQLQVAVRVYDARTEEAMASVRATAPEDSLSRLVDQVTVDLVSSVWRGEEIPAVGRVDRQATANPQALNAYLEAMALSRRGQFAEADEAIERALAEDSTFALAHLQHARIRSWILSMNNQEMLGIRDIVERAMAFRERLTPRNRLRVEALLAQDETNGVQAANLLERILQIDPSDADAWASLAFAEARDSWQMRKRWLDVRATVERAVALDSLNVPLLHLLGLQELTRGDLAAAGAVVDRMETVDADGPVARSFRAGLSLLAAPEPQVDSVIRALAEQEPTTVIGAIRLARIHDLDRAQRFATFLRDSAGPTTNRQLGFGAGLQIAVAKGLLQEVAAAARSQAASQGLRLRLHRYLVATALAGVGEETLAREAAEALRAWAPPDSLDWAIDNRDDAWAAGWAAGAYHAAFGDTVLANAYRAAYEARAPAGIPPEWARAIAFDLQARLAAREGRTEEALEAATQAYDLWSIHDADAGEWDPEPAIRFHMAQRLEAAGREEDAAWYLRSFLDPHWASFYTMLARDRLRDG